MKKLYLLFLLIITCFLSGCSTPSSIDDFLDEMNKDNLNFTVETDSKTIKISNQKMYSHSISTLFGKETVTEYYYDFKNECYYEYSNDKWNKRDLLLEPENTTSYFKDLSGDDFSLKDNVYSLNLIDSLTHGNIDIVINKNNIVVTRFFIDYTYTKFGTTYVKLPSVE